MVSILIGLVIKKTPVIGIVYIPVLDQMYTAIRGRGAYMNDQKLQVSLVRTILFDTSFNFNIKTTHGYSCNFNIDISRHLRVLILNNRYICWKFGPNKMIHL